MQAVFSLFIFFLQSLSAAAALGSVDIQNLKRANEALCAE
jgi:hypothetical protein